MKIPWRASGPEDSLLWRLDLLAGACAVAILVVGCVLDVFLSLIWAVFSSGATIVVLAAFAYSYLHFRPVMSVLEDRLRGRGSYKFDVFISYRHRQHSKIAQSVHAALEDRGLRVWLDKRGGVPRSSWGLFLPMLRGLRSSRAVVFLVPEEEQTKEDLQRPFINGWRDKLKWFCVRPIEQATVWWHQEMYGVRLLKLPDESWQQWERRIALETQVSLFWSVRIDRGDMITSDMERIASSIGGRHEVVLAKQEWSTQPTAAPPVEASELRRENVVVRLDHVEKSPSPSSVALNWPRNADVRYRCADHRRASSSRCSV